MNGNWIKFSERQPEHSQLIWAASVVDCPICTRYSIGRLPSDYTHWMPCERPAQPLPEKSPEELAMEEFTKANPDIRPFEVSIWYAAIRWERNRKK